MSKLGDFERIVILKTIIFNVDENYLSIEDLIKIENIANDLEIIKLKKRNDESIENILKCWKKQVYEKYSQLFDELSLIIKKRK